MIHTWSAGDIIWQERFGIWGHFSKYQPHKRDRHYWNPFGRSPAAFRDNIIVEINPPKADINTNVQGVIARSREGRLAVLHQGRLHPSKIRIDESMFDRVVRRSRVDVQFSSGEVVAYHLVADLDSDALTLQEALANFVIDCERVRKCYLGNQSFSEEEESVALAEGESSPESRGQYEVGPQERRTVIKHHADIWHALVDDLNTLKVNHSNGRIGKYGPDLRTTSRPHILFEIKAGEGISDIQKAVGQLLLYENFLAKRYKKVMVLPTAPTKVAARALRELDIHILPFVKHGRSVTFDPKSLRSLLGRK